MRIGNYLILILCCSLLLTQTLWAQTEVWVRTYNGTANSDDRANSLALDKNGNLYVSGVSTESGTLQDFLTIRYNAGGDTLWIRSYNGPGNDFDQSNALAVDDSGNVYVTGVSYRSATDNDFLTIKYSPNGESLWVRRYNGPTDSSDFANALALDKNGNVFVTGSSTGSGTLGDYATVKYSPYGDSLWVRRYNGPGNGDDVPTAMAVDDSGNVYVTGLSLGVGTDHDYATIKYTSSGDTAWVRRYNWQDNDYDQATAIAVDNNGNVLVSGLSYDNLNFFDFATIKYSPAGDSLWAKRFNGPDFDNDIPSALILEPSGNIILTGSVGTFAGFEDFATVKYNPNGDTLWTRFYQGSAGNYDKPLALTQDKAGNIYVAGVSTGAGTSGDFLVIKYTNAGDTVWTKRYNGAGNDYDQANAITVDTGLNVYVTGLSTGSGTFNDITTIKYASCVAKSGDVTGDNKILLTDIIALINILFRAQTPPTPYCKGDPNGDGVIKLTDIIYLINFLFRSGPAPVKKGVCCL